MTNTTTFTTKSGMTYSISGTRYFKANPISNKKTRISKNEYEIAQGIYAVEQAEEEIERKIDEQDIRAEEPKAKKVRRSKDIAWAGDGIVAPHTVTLTAKQVDFIHHIPDTNFYESGLESTPWCDVLTDEIGGQFAGKPMTVGAMISTLREKGLIYVGTDRINGRKAKYFGFTELGKAIAKELGLN